MPCQKDSFSLPKGVYYLNCATRAPISKAVEQAGYDAIRQQTNPLNLKPDDFFTGAVQVRESFSRLINNPDPDRIAIIPAVSYGMAVVARNLHRKPGLKPGQHILMIEEEFPSDVYAWDRVQQELGLSISRVPMPGSFPKSELWNRQLLEAINTDTAVVVIPPVHWMYGTRFDLESVSRRAKEVGALLVVDGTQAVGALPFNMETVQPDALICAAYKWLMGPYSIGMAYFGEFFDDGIPLEESWMNRLGSNQFHRLTQYEPTYRPKAYRYNMGEHSQFIHMPMAEAALEQLLAWQPETIQSYCRSLTAGALPELEAMGCRIEPEEGRAQHLVGIWLPDHANAMTVQQALLTTHVSVSARGRALRLAPHVYNDEADMQALVDALKVAL
ncbi:aminotransferase class V-fold PLP-dependent enzyme [Nibrella saemangeumensis]|uniref:Aminotransferase class V-fold PLP-dependent enzyme n=1 Tax=Nibrella saemangeumensis TaxID=1084526 RepID=A0ABP8MFM2_9BACT